MITVRTSLRIKILLAMVLATAGTFVCWNLLERASGDGSLLGRPLRVGVVTWPGYAGGLVANNGFKPNKESIYWKDHRLTVEFLLAEDVDVRNKAFAKGGPDGVDVVWSTVDFWANELPGFLKDGFKARAVMQVDWSQGGDAIVADASIHRIEDLYGKKISLALFTPSHWLLEYSLENSSLTAAQQTQIIKDLVGKNASPDARADFVAGRVDAAACWGPDVTEALQKRPGAHILVSSRDAPNLIANIMVAREDFIGAHPDVIKAFVAGWLDGTVEANRNPDLVVKLLMENEALYKDLGPEATRQGLLTVKWADLNENNQMFGLDGGPSLFSSIFKQASEAWRNRGYIQQIVDASQAKDDSFLREIYKANPLPRPSQERAVTPLTQAECEREAVITQTIQVPFARASAVLDANARRILDGVTAPQTFQNATYFCIAGNTDNVGNPTSNVILSEMRAKAVADYLAQHFAINPTRFTYFGYGPYHPVASNSTAGGRARNGRTDISIVLR